MENFHLTKKGAEWQLSREGAKAATLTFRTKKEAMAGSADYLSRAGKPASLKIHGTDGRIGQERTYPRGADPRRSRG